ncbi:MULTISPECIES: glycosyltransferase [unclassified Frankia]|uniref:glycosyltransferase family 2 protein n=1 Tax=unclassified Frankia TaxID=2632575 RepID=UPI001EF6D54B|nr:MULTISPECIES: cellulose synthase catalytic subunit [unclassified Frankia]
MTITPEHETITHSQQLPSVAPAARPPVADNARNGADNARNDARSETRTAISTDPRLAPPAWQPMGPGRALRRRMLLVLPLNVLAFFWYFGWLLAPGRVGNVLLYALLLLAEVFNAVQALGFWWTCSRERVRRRRPRVRAPGNRGVDQGAGLGRVHRKAEEGVTLVLGVSTDDNTARCVPQPRDAASLLPVALSGQLAVDVLVPVYNEPVDVVEPTLAAAVRMRGAQVHVCLLDDGDNPRMAALASRYGVTYITRPDHRGAKAGNLNHALGRTSAPIVVIFDCDHVPHPEFLEATLGYLDDPGVGFVQTPQYYANASTNEVAGTSWAQQALFFGGIARGKDGLGAMFCCGTNIAFRRTALAEVGGFPEDSLTEDFELSIRMHTRGWRSVYVPEVLASGLGPADMASYTSQQLRWSRGCISAIPAVLAARLPRRLKAQYLLSAGYFLSGWTVLIYMIMPMMRIMFGIQPITAASADQFLLHFAPYFTVALGTVALAGNGSYTFAAFTLQSASFWIGVVSTVRALLRRPGRFVVTPKQGGGHWQPTVVVVPVAVAMLLIAASIYGLARDQGPGMANSVAFAGVHAALLLRGSIPALGWRGRTARTAVARDAPPIAA